MNIGLYLLAAGLLMIVLIGIFWWRRSRRAKSRAKREQQRFSREAVKQPWSDDKQDGRGNR